MLSEATGADGVGSGRSEKPVGVGVGSGRSSSFWYWLMTFRPTCGRYDRAGEVGWLAVASELSGSCRTGGLVGLVGLVVLPTVPAIGFRFTRTAILTVRAAPTGLPAGSTLDASERL